MKRICITLTDHEYEDIKILAKLADRTVHQLFNHLMEANLVHYKDEIAKAKEEIEN